MNMAKLKGNFKYISNIFKFLVWNEKLRERNKEEKKRTIKLKLIKRNRTNGAYENIATWWKWWYCTTWKTNWSRLNDGIALLPSLLTPSFSFLHFRPIRLPSFTLLIDYTINDDKQNRITQEAIEIEFESKKEQTKLNWTELD